MFSYERGTPVRHVPRGVAAGAVTDDSQGTPTPLESPYVPRHRATVRSYGRGVSYERGTPVKTRYCARFLAAGRIGQLMMLRGAFQSLTGKHSQE